MLADATASNIPSPADLSKTKRDFERLESSVHIPIRHDCPMKGCPLKDGNGFPRRDHLVEHLRSYHHWDVPKRRASKRAPEVFPSSTFYSSASVTYSSPRELTTAHGAESRIPISALLQTVPAQPDSMRKNHFEPNKWQYPGCGEEPFQTKEMLKYVKFRNQIDRRYMLI